MFQSAKTRFWSARIVLVGTNFIIYYFYFYFYFVENLF